MWKRACQAPGQEGRGTDRETFFQLLVWVGSGGTGMLGQKQLPFIHPGAVVRGE